MKKIILFFFLVISASSFSQTFDTIAHRRLSSEEFENLQKMYLKVRETKLVKRKIATEELFFSKRSLFTPSEDMKPEKRYKRWLSKNLNLTTFTSVHEGIFLLRKMHRFQKRFQKKYPELSDKLKHLTIEQRVKLNWKNY